MCSMGLAGCHTPARGLAIRRAVPARAPARVRSKFRSSHFEPQVAVILGMQWGDEGKGKLVDVLAKQYDIVARAQGGANAGHTIYDDEGKQYKLHLVPSGILNRSTLCVIGNGVVIHLPSLMAELEDLQAKGVTNVMDRIVISERAHLLFDLHKDIDAKREEESKSRKIGTTKRGIGPAYASKATRNGLRVCDLKNADVFQEKLDRLVEDTKARWGDMSVDTNAQLAQYAVLAKDILPMMCDTVDLLNTACEEGKRVLVEGANATMLDLDFGTYPFVTSSNPSIGGVVTGLGLAPNKFGAIIGVAKAYSTRVGEGPYPTEVFGQLAEDLRDKGAEFGTTTGRPRRIGWLDMVALKYACRINGLTHINLTKLDVLSDLDEIPIGVGYKLGNGKTIVATFPADLGEVQDLDVEYEGLPGWKSEISNVRSWDELPEAAQMYCQRVEDLTGVHVKWIGVGPGRDALIEKPSAL